MKYIISFLLKRVPRKYLQRVSYYLLKLLAIFYTGNKVQCPVCLSRFRQFLPYGRKARSNALCPNCLALERHRLMWLYLKQKTDFFTKPQKVLHIAPEHCFLHRFEKMANLEYISADIESPLAKVKMDIHDIPFDANTFDVAFCNHVMEHVEDDIRSMSELHRVLKPGGWAIIQVPFFPPLPDKTWEDITIQSPKEREKAFGQDDHVRKYGKDYPQRLERGGFSVIPEDYAKHIPEELAGLYAVPKDETIYLCRKD